MIGEAAQLLSNHQRVINSGSIRPGHRPVEPEVGIEPTTYHLPEGRYPYALASTSNSSHGLGIMDHSATHGLTRFRVTNRATRPVSSFA
jgi:hypothetical protein